MAFAPRLFTDLRTSNDFSCRARWRTACPDDTLYALVPVPVAKHRQNVNTLTPRFIAAAVLLSALVLGCSSAKPTAQPAAAVMPDHQHMAGMSMPVTIPKGALYTEADVRFMQGMIAHHAQAIYMSRLAVSRGANPRLLKFATKIDQSQQAEIRLMQEWLRANGQSAPDTSSWRTMSMPGMLTTAQLAQLDAARGTEFDRQFLVLMIQHHEGALKMVADLLATPLAAQDVDVSVFANDVDVVQTAEIALMQQMLANL
jgi:uncharacterized protein (DUF305 family)